MYENGAANTSFEDVRKAAKASGSQISHYFADKRSLIRAVIAHRADAVMADRHDTAFGKLDSIAALRTWTQRIVEQQRAQNFEGGCRLGSLAAELLEAEAGSWSDRHPWSRRGDGVASLRSLSPRCERPECRSGARLLRASCRRPSARRPDRLAYMGYCPYRHRGHVSGSTRDRRTLPRRMSGGRLSRRASCGR
jgi:AcrR family transcriptional regulator